MTNCINCGAILHGDKCEYCGTEYKNNGISAKFNNDDYARIIKIGNEEINAYISSMEGHLFEGNSWTDAQGIIHRDKPKMKRTFTLVEI